MPDLKNLAGRFAGAAARTARGAASFAAKKTKNVSRIAKLNVDIASERDAIKRVYREIGKLYYETHREDPESYFIQLCQEIDVAMESIAIMEAEIVQLKTRPAPEESADAEEAPPADSGPKTESEEDESDPMQ